MENNGILEFISKLQAAANNKAAANSDRGDNNANTQGENPTNRKNSNTDKPEQNPNRFVRTEEEKDDKSFMRSYNPFGSAAFERPQVVAPRAKKPLKEKIDLATSKNVTVKNKPEIKNDMVQLINKHNRISAKLHGRNTR